MKKIKNNKTKSILLLLTLIFSTIFAFTTITLAGGPSQFEKLWGWDKDRGRWETGNLQGWMEDDYVNHRLEIDNFAGGTLTFVINLDYTSGSVIGLDKAVQFYLGDGEGNQNDPQEAITKYIGPIVDRNSPLEIGESDKATTSFGTLTVTRLPNGPGKAGDSALRYKIEVTTNLKHWFVYWESHLAIGSSQWNGASLHVYTDEWGSKDVPIMVPPSPQGADLAITKSGPNYAHVGDTITYTYTVTNAGPASATGVEVTDNKTGTATYVSGDTNGNVKLDVGETWIFTATYTVSGTDPDPLTNTATVTSTTKDPNMANNQASWTVDILHPKIDVSKTGPSYAHEGDNITYTITVTNTGDCRLSSVSVVDSLIGAIYSDGDGLNVGEAKTFTVPYTVPTPSGDVANTVTAEGRDALGLKVTDSASWTVYVLHPAIDVIKSANATMIHEGDWVEYNITVVNKGDCPLNVTLSDTLLGVSWSGTLESGQKHEVTVSFQPTADPTFNTASASGTDALGKTVSDSDSWTVDILHPAIEVTKTADKSKAYAGDTITYTITVKNTGDCTLYNVIVEDETLGINKTIGELAAGASENFTVSYTVKVGDPDPFVNTVTASGEDFLGGKVTANDSAKVDLVAKICGFKFHDKNANGVWDEGEEGVEGWTIELWLGETKLYETTTASDGSYCFDGLNATTYTVKEVAKQGWMNTTPKSIEITLQSGEISEDNNFGNIKLGSISGYKFYDANADGVRDGGEVAIEGWKVHLTGTNILGGTVDLYAFTDEEGKFTFKDLLPGTYTVEEVFPPPELNNGCMWINTTKPSFTHKLEGGEDYVGPEFGNVCLMPGTGGKTLGFWSNKNGQALINSTDVIELNKLNLYKPSGWTYPKFSSDLATAKSQIKNYLLSATAQEMKWMLSAQLIATKLNVLHGFLNPNTIIYIDGKFISIGEIIGNANSALTGTDRTQQEYWKNLLDGVNNNRFYFICDEPCYPITYP